MSAEATLLQNTHSTPEVGKSNPKKGWAAIAQSLQLLAMGRGCSVGTATRYGPR
jgi:hypothetical protein